MIKRPSSTSFLLGVLFLVILLYLFFSFGGSIWRPVLAQLRGQNTVASVLKELKPKMLNTFSDLESITDGTPLTILAFKEQRILEVWKQEKLVKTYPFKGYSGRLGPKRQRGDGQIPEGIYSIDYLNPNSSYHLSFKVSYPNQFDRNMAASDGRTNLGDDIFIHGSSVTIGCIPVGNPAIEELFYLVGANGKQNCKIIISPRDFRTGSSDPEISQIEWESKLYQKIRHALKAFPP